MSIPPLLHYRAGPEALRILRSEGLTPETVGAVTGPASGPRWLVLAGIDGAMMETGLVSSPRPGEPRRLLVGASAGAWRMLAMAGSEPRETHRRLLHEYIHQAFPRKLVASEVSASYRRMLAGLFGGGRADILARHPDVDLAVHTTRLRGPLPWRRRFVQAPAMFLSVALNAVARNGTSLLFQRVLHHTRPGSFEEEFQGELPPLTRENLLEAALATGSVPFYMEPVRSIRDAPAGSYLDGGLLDYHLRQRYVGDGSGLTLFPHFQERIAPVWFDRYPPRRAPLPSVLANVLQVYPSREFIASLPGGRTPERDDFFTFVDSPEERFRRWSEAAARSELLGERFLQDLREGAVPDRVEPMPGS